MDTLQTQTDSVTQSSIDAGMSAAQIRDVVSFASSSDSVSSFFVRSMRALFADIGASFAYGIMRDGAFDIDERIGDGSGGWAEAAENDAIECVTESRRLVRLYRSETGVHVLSVASPIMEQEGRSIGGVTVLFAIRSEDPYKHLIASVEAACDAIAAGLPLVQSQRSQSQPSLVDHDAQTGVVRSSEYRTAAQLAFAITNNLRARLDADVVAFGIPKKKRIKLLSISGMDSVKPRSPGTLPMRQAMEESLDTGRVTCYQLDEEWSGTRATTGHRMHRAWHEQTGGSAVLTIPVRVGDDVVCLVGMKRNAKNPFTVEEVQSTAQSVQPFGIGFELVERASRSLPKHAASVSGRSIKGLFAPRGWGMKALIVGMIALCSWIAFGTASYQLTVPASVRAPGKIVLTAPFGGSLLTLHVESGVQVSEGQLVASMDTAALESELDSLTHILETHQIEIDQAIAVGDRNAAELARAQFRRVQTDINAVRRRIEGAHLRSPFDGVILTSHAEDRIGEVFVQGAPILSIAPLMGANIKLDLPEHAAGWVTTRSTGVFVPIARPGYRCALSVTEVAPAAEPTPDGVVIAAKASMDQPSHWIKPGMTGTARLNLGERPVWWIGFHRAIDAVRLRFWI